MKNEQLLNVQLLARSLDISYDTLRRYVTAKGVSELMGGTKVKGELGVRFPEESLDRWHYLVALHNAGAISPRTASAVLRLHSEAPVTSETPSAEANELTVMSDLQCVAVALHRLARSMERKNKRKRR